jgi:anti-anti-sigma factor
MSPSPAVLVMPADVTNEILPSLERDAVPLLRSDAALFVVDMRQTNFLSSGGLGLLVKWGKSLSERGASLALTRPKPPIQRLLRSIGLDTILPWFPDVDAAAAHFVSRGAAR